MARSDPQINLRIPAELKERIEAAAATNKRSMNAEISNRLERSFEADFSAERNAWAELSSEKYEEAMVRAVKRAIKNNPDIFAMLRAQPLKGKR